MLGASFSHRDTDGRLIHRIESFSDLVIGFSIALLALTLVLPDHTMKLFTDWSWLAIYFWTFFVVAAIWFSHQRLFSRYFVATPATIILNFVLLALVGLVVFFVQVFGHVHGSLDKGLAFCAYWFLLGSEWGVIGALFAIGLRARWEALDDFERRDGRKHALRGALLCGGTYCGVALAGIGGFTMQSAVVIAPCVVLSIMASRFLHYRGERNRAK